MYHIEMLIEPKNERIKILYKIPESVKSSVKPYTKERPSLQSFDLSTFPSTNPSMAVAPPPELQHPKRDLIRSYELRLLRCTYSPPPPSSGHQSQSVSSPSSGPLSSKLHETIDQVLSFIENGNYLQALSFAELLSLDFSDEGSDDDRICSQLDTNVERFIVNGDDDEEEIACRMILVLCFGVASLFYFTQCNTTGPLDELSSSPLPFKCSEGKEKIDWEAWARNQLMSDGSELLGKFSNLQCIVFAKILAMKTKDLLFKGSVSSTYGMRSTSWWLSRVLYTEQRVLHELSSSVFDFLQVYVVEMLNHFDSREKVTNYWGAKLLDEEASTLVSIANLEAGIIRQHYGHVDLGRMHIDSAEAAAGLQLSVTGVLGYRTIHQVAPTVQAVLVSNRSSVNDGGRSSSVSSGSQSKVLEESLDALKEENSESSDILRKPKLLGNCGKGGTKFQPDEIGGPGAASSSLSPTQQAVILAHCILIEKGSRQDELQKWEVAPYIEAIDSQPSSLFALRHFCDLLRVRWESTRSHTKVRAEEMMRKLVEDLEKLFPGVAQRIPFCYVTNIPTIPALKKEYGELLVSCGLVGEALGIFEGLELWDNLIHCNILLDKKPAAVELIRKRLSETPKDPRLWCSLGDVTNDDSCYEKALEVSNNKSARAKRSLARSAYNRGEYDKSKVLWESAMALNSLFPDGWFALGAAALKARDLEKALDGFTRAVQLDPDHGESWNNIACLHMMKKRSKESFIAFNEALKYKRDSWEMWENLGHVAMDVDNIWKALEAVQRVVDTTDFKRIDVELLERIMAEMERRSSSTDLSSEVEVGNPRETMQLLELLGKLLQKIVKKVSRPDIWGLFARWHRIKGDLTMCSEALLKQIRAYQGSDLWKDKDRFIKFAHASLELSKVYMELSSSTGSRRELSSAEMHLKQTIKQAESFSGTQEFQDLQTCLDEVRLKLESHTARAS
ncbi:Tetratricopeptide repeat protein 27 homolog [Linum grandiflorum]